MINKKGEMYNIIHTIDPNINPDILTSGSNMFKFIKKKKNKFVLDIRNNDEELKRYLSYSEENMCKTFEWLKQHRFIYYSKVDACYILTDSCINILRIGNDL